MKAVDLLFKLIAELFHKVYIYYSKKVDKKASLHVLIRSIILGASVYTIPSLIFRIGHDFAISYLSNHTIMSRGTFSLWTSYFANGVTFLPCHHQNSRNSKYDIYEVCNRDPFKYPLRRLFPQLI